MRDATERDFRRPEFRDAKAEDYEIRDDGAVVRKDRWECGIGSIRSILGLRGREFEIPDVVFAARAMASRFNGWVVLEKFSPEDFDKDAVESGLWEIRLDDGSVLRDAQVRIDCGLVEWRWRNEPVPWAISAVREQQALLPVERPADE